MDYRGTFLRVSAVSAVNPSFAEVRPLSLGAALDRAQPHAADDVTSRTDDAPVDREGAARGSIAGENTRLGRDQRATVAVWRDLEIHGCDGEPGRKRLAKEFGCKRAATRPWWCSHHGADYQLM